jgi:hypothetical protein
MIPTGPITPTNVRDDSRSLLSLAGIAELLAFGEIAEVGNYAAGEGIEIIATADWKKWKSVFSPKERITLVRGETYRMLHHRIGRLVHYLLRLYLRKEECSLHSRHR